MNRNTLLVGALVLLLLAGPLVWLTSMDPAPAPPGAAPASARSTQSAVQRKPRGPRAVEEPQPERVATEEPAPAAAPAPQTPAPPPRLVLKCRLDGLDPEVPAAPAVAVVERTGERRGPTLGVEVGAADHFDVDVSSFAGDDGGSLDVTITVERRGYLTASAAVSAWVPAVGQAAQSKAVVLRLTVAGWVKGIVQDERFQRVAGAEVGAWIPFRDNWIRIDATRTDDEGVFRLRLQPDAANLVVVIAPGTTPASAQVTGVARAESELTPFTLQPGLAVSGSVKLADGRAIADAAVVATPIWAKTDIALGRQALAYRGGLIFRCPAVAPASDGQFRVEGLVPGDYDLTVAARGYAPDLLATVQRRVSPPLERVDLVLDPVRVVVQVTADGRPAPRISVPVKNANGVVTVETDAKGLAEFFVKPRTDYLIEFQPPGFDKYGRSFNSPAPGAEASVAVELRRRASWPQLLLRLPSEDAAGEGALQAADVVLTPEDEAPDAAPERSETVVFDHGRATLDGLFAGTFVVTVTPRGEGYRLPLARRATLRDGATTRLDLRFPHGGRIKIVVRDPGGAPAAATWRVLADVREEELDADEAGSDVLPLLPPGRYRVVVTPRGGEPITTRATVVVDKTVDVTVTVPAVRDGG